MAREFTPEEMATLGTEWSYLRESPTQSGLFIIRRFFTMFPEEVRKFPFNLDSGGKIRPNHLFSNGVRNHAAKIMDALDAGKKDSKRLIIIHTTTIIPIIIPTTN